MDFKQWIFNEHSLIDLYNSSVEAFPNTTKRQHATDTIKISELRWTPFLGMKTLLIRGIAQNENKEYTPMILMKGVKYYDKKYSNNIVPLFTEGRIYLLEKLSLKETQVVLRCSCADYFWRGNYANALQKINYGNKRKKYESLNLRPPVNPDNAPMMCKHLMKMMKAIHESGVAN